MLLLKHLMRALRIECSYGFLRRLDRHPGRNSKLANLALNKKAKSKFVVTIDPNEKD